MSRRFNKLQSRLHQFVSMALVTRGRLDPTSIAVGEFTIVAGFASEGEAQAALRLLVPAFGRSGSVYQSPAGVHDRGWDRDAGGGQVLLWRVVCASYPISDQVWGQEG